MRKYKLPARKKKEKKKRCDWCGKTFRATTPYTEYDDGTCYHYKCLKNVGGPTDLGRLYERV